MRLLVTLAGLEPGVPLAAAVYLADALDARRVPLTLLVGPRPHPEVAAWAAARRRAGDAALLHGTREGEPGRPYGRLPAHEAGLRLAAALRTRDVVGLPVDGFAAPGWATSTGIRRALAGAGVDLLVDDAGVHRLTADGTARVSVRGGPAGRAGRGPAGDLRRCHGTVATPAGASTLIEAVDAHLAAGVVPHAATALLAPSRGAPLPRRDADPEQWSITA